MMLSGPYYVVGVVGLKIADVQIGRDVTYTPFKGCSSDQIEYGVVTGKNDRFVFVRYGNDQHSKATDACDIEYTLLGGDRRGPVD